MKIQDQSLLSEGGYGYIWKAVDTNTKQTYAVKKMLCQKKASASNCQNIIQCYETCTEQNGDGFQTVKAVLEFCQDGSLFDLMQIYKEQKFSEKQIIHIISDVAYGLQQVHRLNFAHNDIKIENILLNSNKFKLCDFGSCTHSENALDFSVIEKSSFYKYEEQFEKTTTMMYRPPEMCDLYLGYTVSQKTDIWMLGCVVYVLCFYKHPFEDSSKLAIIDALFTFPSDSKYSEKMHDFIRHLLTPNPKYRPTIDDVVNVLQNYFSLENIPLNEQALMLKRKHEEYYSQFNKTYSQNVNQMKLKSEIPQTQENILVKTELQKNQDFMIFKQKQVQESAQKDLNQSADNFGDTLMQKNNTEVDNSNSQQQHEPKGDTMNVLDSEFNEFEDSFGEFQSCQNVPKQNNNQSKQTDSVVKDETNDFNEFSEFQNGIHMLDSKYGKPLPNNNIKA